MIDSYGRGVYQTWIVEPLIRTGVFDRLRPNTVTLIATCVGALTIPFALLGWGPPAAGALLLSGFLDTLDGTLARARGQTSNRGTLLDITSDRLVESCAIIALYLIHAEGRALLCLLMLAAALLCITTFLTVGIFTENSSEKGFHYSPGLMERFEAIAILTVMLALPTTFFWGAIIFTAGTLFTAVYRTYEFLKN